jgi:hypothetical protein
MYILIKLDALFKTAENNFSNLRKLGRRVSFSGRRGIKERCELNPNNMQIKENRISNISQVRD